MRFAMFERRRKTVKPISLEIVTGMMTTFSQCRSCTIVFDEAGLNEKIRQKVSDEYPPDFIEASQKLSEWIQELKQLYRHRLVIRLIDAKSFLGFYKSLRHRIRKYPGFIVDGKETCIGWDKKKLEDLLDKSIKTSILSRKQNLQPTLP
jgi:hypothetical protein